MAEAARIAGLMVVVGHTRHRPMGDQAIHLMGDQAGAHEEKGVIAMIVDPAVMTAIVVRTLGLWRLAVYSYWSSFCSQ
jgi:hypothetical protein